MPGLTETPEATCVRLRQRREFLMARRLGKKWVRPGMIVQFRRHQPDVDASLRPSVMRLGFTVSKKVGNAVSRNRAKRRLRAVADQVMVKNAGFLKKAAPGFDLVIIGRAATLTRPFQDLLGDLQQALKKLNVFRDGSPDRE